MSLPRKKPEATLFLAHAFRKDSYQQNAHSRTGVHHADGVFSPKGGAPVDCAHLFRVLESRFRGAKRLHCGKQPVDDRLITLLRLAALHDSAGLLYLGSL